MPYSDWFPLQIQFVNSELPWNCHPLQAVIIPNRTLSVKKIWLHKPSAWLECKIKPQLCLISRNLKPLNALRNVWLSSWILNQWVTHVELPSSFLMNSSLRVWRWLSIKNAITIDVSGLDGTKVYPLRISEKNIRKEEGKLIIDRWRR